MAVFQFSLRWLLVSVTLVAGALVALLCASTILSDCLAIAWCGLLLVAILGVVYRSQSRRAFWVGFCVLGWPLAAYLYFDHGTNTIVDDAATSVHDAVKWSVPASEDDVHAHDRNGGTWEASPGGVRRIFFPRLSPFLSISNSLLGMVVATMGGLIARWFHATRDRS